MKKFLMKISSRIPKSKMIARIFLKNMKAAKMLMLLAKANQMKVKMSTMNLHVLIIMKIT